jgi:hypothetical protein
MAKRLLVALMLAVAFMVAFFAIRTFQKKNESVIYSKDHIWQAEFDPDSNTGRIIRGRRINEIRNDVNKLIIALNKVVEEAETIRPRGDAVNGEFPRIILQKVEKQTAFVEIANDRYVTQNMGSSGAQDYLASATFTITEHPGIRSVDFSFTAGDHALPGAYSRESFGNYTIVTGDGRKP